MREVQRGRDRESARGRKRLNNTESKTEQERVRESKRVRHLLRESPTHSVLVHDMKEEPRGRERDSERKKEETTQHREQARASESKCKQDRARKTLTE